VKFQSANTVPPGVFTPLQAPHRRIQQGDCYWMAGNRFGAIHATLFIKRDSKYRNSLHVGVIAHPIRLHFELRSWVLR
jgi:hypothetical protein